MGRLAVVLLRQGLLGLLDGPDHVDHVHREANGTGLVAETAGDGLADPPGRVGGELETLPPIELLHRPDQPQVAFLNEIEEIEPATGISLGDRNDQAQIAADEGHLGFLTVVDQPEQPRPLVRSERRLGLQLVLGLAAALHGARQPNLVLCVQQSMGRDLLEVDAHRVVHRN